MLPVTYMPSAEKYFRKLKYEQLKSAYKAAIYKIRENPHLGNAKTGDLSGIFSLDVYYNGTNYELAYRISRLDNGEIIVVIMAGTRENFYKELKRYIK
ncbi:MAG: type II toxin-antitoxin system RelE/ParE family toxin [Youngiibacter sp.]|nr:type II toxin-antitoxin system RelE/ParE family toxin [Youngiibacter sp.]